MPTARYNLTSAATTSGYIYAMGGSYQVNGSEQYLNTVEVANLNSPTPTPTPDNSLVTAINAGGNSQGSYNADTDYSGGSTYTSNAVVNTANTTNPAPQA